MAALSEEMVSIFIRYTTETERGRQTRPFRQTFCSVGFPQSREPVKDDDTTSAFVFDDLGAPHLVATARFICHGLKQLDILLVQSDGSHEGFVGLVFTTNT